MSDLAAIARMLGDGRMTFGDVSKQGLNVLWQDAHGITHECSGNMVHPNILLIWTLCDRDVPDNAATISAEAGDCAKCLARKERP